MQSHSPTRWLCSLLCLSALAFGQPPQRIYAAHLVSKVEPVYPPVAKKNGIHGTVRLDVTIGKDGHVAKLATAHGHDGIGSPASRRTPAPLPSARGWSSSSKPAPKPRVCQAFPYQAEVGPPVARRRKDPLAIRSALGHMVSQTFQNTSRITRHTPDQWFQETENLKLSRAL